MNSKYLQPKKYFYYVIKKIKGFFSNLENHGERVDIVFSNPVLLDENEKCHLKRYQFASECIKGTDTVGDFACGTGYGTALLATKAATVLGIDIDSRVVSKIAQKYKHTPTISFKHGDLLQIDFVEQFDRIVSFETIEHFIETDIVKLLHLFNTALKPGGMLIMSTPYMQKDDRQALRAGFHKTFFINEEKIKEWLSQSMFDTLDFYYQSYDWPAVSKADVDKDFVICIAHKS
jgi:cyclopropane fatty-acyl-phospholipid synthase-like methyltransferase